MPSIAEEMAQWLHHRVAPQDIDAHASSIGSPIDPADPEWQALIAQLDARRELWYFKSPPETWVSFPLRGMEGYALVEQEQVVDFYLTAMS